MNLKYSGRNASMVLEITGKFNVIVGESGSGKSDMAALAARFQQADVNTVIKPRPIYSSAYRDVAHYLPNAQESVFIIDEGFETSWLHACIPAMKQSSNYFIFITRDGLAEVPYGVDNTFRVAGRHNQYYMVPMYQGLILTRTVGDFDSIVTEDSGLGYDLVKCIASTSHTVSSAHGKSKISAAIAASAGVTLVIFDTCGIGKEFDYLLEAQQAGECILFDSLSLEHEILSKVFSKHFIPFDVEKAKQYPSEEAYYVQQLQQILREYYGITYSKSESALVDLLENGTVVLHGKVLRLLDAGGVNKAAYSELRSAQKPSTGLKKMSLF